MLKREDIQVNSNERLLFISDIHADLTSFKAILKKARFNQNDHLFILGDLIEKGTDNLKILDYIIGLIDHNYKVHIIMGNCDNVLSYMIPPVSDELLINYALVKKKTIINNFADKLHIKITNTSDMNSICEKYVIKFKKYYDFILNLPHIIFINDKIVLVHGGIDDINNLDISPIKVMKNDNFYLHAKPQDKLMIVGHYPTINYHNDYPDSNPIIDLNKMIISIDGGCNVVLWGQLNLLIIDNIDDMNISYISYDDFPKGTITNDIEETNENLLNLTASNHEYSIIRQHGDYYECVNSKTNIELPILKSFVDKYDETYYSSAFNYKPSLKKGTKVKIIYEGDPFTIIKYKGVAGLVDRHNVKRDRHGILKL